MTFAVTGEAYDRFMGRYSQQLAPLMIDFAEIDPSQRVLDVGCGPGALTARLARRVGAERIAAVDPSESFVAACAARVPGADVRRGEAGSLPWPDGTFDAVLSQLVINFLPDPVRGVAESVRVSRPGGMLAACVWDYGDRMQLLRAFWNAARELDPEVPDEGQTMRIRTAEALDRLWREGGVDDVGTASLVVRVHYLDFADLWDSLQHGVGPAGAYCRSLDDQRRAVLRDGLFAGLGSPAGPFTCEARAWAVRGRTRSAGA
jgi:SAM-dependent methyltransferase